MPCSRSRRRVPRRRPVRAPAAHSPRRICPSRPATRTLTWVNCGHPPAYLADAEGRLTELENPIHRALGLDGRDPAFTVAQRELHSGERVILVTDGITQRHTEGGGRFGVDGLQRAVAGVEHPTAAATAMAILQAVSECWREPLEDDGTVAVLAVA